jgi:hypothetical protein
MPVKGKYITLEVEDKNCGATIQLYGFNHKDGVYSN